MAKRVKLTEDVRKLERFVGSKKAEIVLTPEPLKLTIEAIVNESAEKTSAAARVRDCAQK
jgi:hypothetical protein